MLSNLILNSSSGLQAPWSFSSSLFKRLATTGMVDAKKGRRGNVLVVGVGRTDAAGSKAALQRAATLLKNNDTMFVVHVPRPVPSTLFSSLIDPGDSVPQ
jgi:D-arabinose 5-phosphate isomerase GutQ